MIRHIVLWNLVAEHEAEKALAVAELSAALHALTTSIPEILALSVSRNIANARENHEIALVVDFASVADLDSYTVHPDHVAVGPIVRERTTGRVCVDIEL